MKNKILMSIVLSLLLSGVILSKTAPSKSVEIEVSSDSYCLGFEEGYCEGWTHIKGEFAMCPFPPPCPFPEMDCSEGYRCGYNKGFIKGMYEARH